MEVPPEGPASTGRSEKAGGKRWLAGSGSRPAGSGQSCSARRQKSASHGSTAASAPRSCWSSARPTLTNGRPPNCSSRRCSCKRKPDEGKTYKNKKPLRTFLAAKLNLAYDESPRPRTPKTSRLSDAAARSLRNRKRQNLVMLSGISPCRAEWQSGFNKTVESDLFQEKMSLWRDDGTSWCLVTELSHLAGCGADQDGEVLLRQLADVVLIHGRDSDLEVEPDRQEVKSCSY